MARLAVSSGGRHEQAFHDRGRPAAPEATPRRRRGEICLHYRPASNPEAAEAGDSSVWHDNFAYEENQRQMHQWAHRVRDLRLFLSNVELVEPPARPEAVTIGCAVEVVDSATGRTSRYLIAGCDDGDLKAGRLSCNSPVGLALLGARVGESREVRSGGRERQLDVLTVTRAEEDQS
jgi:transcription elongation GreA/GreB family factor